MMDYPNESPLKSALSPVHGLLMAGPEPCAPDVLSATAVGSATLQVRLADGRTGLLDVTWLLEYPAFARLKEAGYFSRVAVALGTVTWPEGEDISPESVSARLK